MVTVAVCTVYMLVGPLLIMSNKYLLTSGSFHYPILLTTMHQVSSSICCFLIRVFEVVPLAHEVTWRVWRTNIFAVGLMTMAALCTGNASYLYLTVAFVEILKGFTPVVTMTVQSMFGEPLPSCRVAGAVLMISFGTAVSSFGEVHMNLTGLMLMLASVYCEATRLMLTQKLLLHMNLHVLEGLYYISPVSALCAFAVAAVVEMPNFETKRVLHSLPETWHLFTVNAFLGFLVNVVSFLVIKRTNVVMLKLLAISRNALVVFVGIVLFAEHVSGIQFLGYTLSILFFAAYNYILLKEKRAAADARRDGACGRTIGRARCS